jgi:hypothetical protein
MLLTKLLPANSSNQKTNLRTSSLTISTTKSKKSNFKKEKFIKLIKLSKSSLKIINWTRLPKIKILSTNILSAILITSHNSKSTSMIYCPTSTIHSLILTNVFALKQLKIFKYLKKHRFVTDVKENATQTVFG